jgi:hypothetical protein
LCGSGAPREVSARHAEFELHRDEMGDAAGTIEGRTMMRLLGARFCFVIGWYPSHK